MAALWAVRKFIIGLFTSIAWWPPSPNPEWPYWCWPRTLKVHLGMVSLLNRLANSRGPRSSIGPSEEPVGGSFPGELWWTGEGRRIVWRIWRTECPAMNHQPAPLHRQHIESINCKPISNVCLWLGRKCGRWGKTLTMDDGGHCTPGTNGCGTARGRGGARSEPQTPAQVWDACFLKDKCWNASTIISCKIFVCVGYPGSTQAVVALRNVFCPRNMSGVKKGPEARNVWNIKWPTFLLVNMDIQKKRLKKPQNTQHKAQHTTHNTDTEWQKIMMK